MVPSNIVVGVDAIHERWLWRKRFIPMFEVVDAIPEDDSAIRLRLTSGADEVLFTTNAASNAASNAGSHREHRDALLARINEARARQRSQNPTAELAALLRRDHRSSRQWRRDLEGLMRNDFGYRHAPVRDEDLWRVLEDPRAPEDARAAAAFVLRKNLDAEGKARVRVAADATASPKLGVALSAAASDAEAEADAGAEADAVLAALAPEDDEVAARHAG